MWSTLNEKDDREEKVRYLRERQSIVLRRKEVRATCYGVTIGDLIFLAYSTHKR